MESENIIKRSQSIINQKTASGGSQRELVPLKIFQELTQH